MESKVVFEALYSCPNRRRRTLFERDGDDLALRRGTRFTGGGRELITPRTLVLSAANRLTEEIDRVARWLRNINFVGHWLRGLIPKESPMYRPGPRWARLGWDDYLIDIFVVVDGRLLISRRQVLSEDITHAVLADGRAVEAAGEFEVAREDETITVSKRNNMSGHYRPGADSLSLAREAFETRGVPVRPGCVRAYDWGAL